MASSRPRTWRDGVGRTSTGPTSPSSLVPPLPGGNPEGDDPHRRGSDPPSTPHRSSPGRSSETRKYVDYKMDPAPAWGGDQPEKHFKEYHRNLQLWLVEAEARLPLNLIGKRIIDSIPLGSKLSSLLAHLTVAEICADDGHRVILRLIEDAHDYLKDLSLEQAFEEAIFRGRRERGQPLTAFMTTKKAAFAELKKQGLDLLDTKAGRHLLGHLLLRQGSFSQDQRQRLKVVTNGSIDYKDIEVAIQKVFGDKLDESYGDAGQRRWRRPSSYWEEEADGVFFEENEEDELGANNISHYDAEEEDYDIIEDFMCLSDNGEAQLIFYDELPVIMEEVDALQCLADSFEAIFYESRDRLHFKGKGKGKKGKDGKGKGGRTFGAAGKPSFGGGRGQGGYLAHRRALQAARNARGYDKPWQRRSGSRLSLTELQSRSRCHQCKQVGHWSRDCPQRSKPSSPARTVASSSAATSVNHTMAAGFFVQSPKHVTGETSQYLTLVDENLDAEQYVQPPSSSQSFLSYVFFGANRADGTALVDTAAQHGLVGVETLRGHARLLEPRFGLKVQWSQEPGGVVRGVCGAEETTKVAYVPIGLGGKSGVLRVQVVPGDIPFLLPAYFLTDLAAVIDMKHATIMYMSLGVKQDMIRLQTGHVAVSIIEFGSGFQIPTDMAFFRSQAWSTETVPVWSDLAPSDATADVMAPVAALVAAALHLAFPSRMADMYGGRPNTSATFGAAVDSEAREVGARSPSATPTRASFDRSGVYGKCKSVHFDFGEEGRPAPTFGLHHGQGQVPGSETGGMLKLPTCGDQAWCKPHPELSEVSQVQPRASHAFGSHPGASALERCHGLPQAGLQDQEREEGEVCEVRGDHRISGDPRLSAQKPSTRIFQCTEEVSSIRGDGGGFGDCWDSSTNCRLGGERLGHGRCTGVATSAESTLQPLPTRTADAVSTSGHAALDLDLRQPAVQVILSGSGDGDRLQCATMSQLPLRRTARGEPESADLPVPTLQVSSAAGFEQDQAGVPEDGPVHSSSSSRQPPHCRERLSGWWSSPQLQSLHQDESFNAFLAVLGVNANNTYITTGSGAEVPGLCPVVTMPVVNRRIIATKHGKNPWNAVHVTTVPGETYEFGMDASYVILYEFSEEFIDYMVDTEFENELTLTKAMKTELNQQLDLLLGDQTAYWNLWQEAEADDIAEIFGGLTVPKESVVELYSPPRLVEEAVKRGLNASLSIDLATGYDLNQPEVRQHVREELRRRKPRLLLACPPCKKFSPLQHLRQDQHQLQHELGEAVVHVDFSMEMLNEQADRGDHGLYEHPDTASSWELPSVINFLERDEVILVKSHLCRFGLMVKEKLNRKSTLFATTCDTIAVELQKLCQCDELHQPLVGGLPQLAQTYPPKLVKAMIDGLIQEWIDSQHGRPSHLPGLADLEQWAAELNHRDAFQWRQFHDCAVLVARFPKHVPVRGPGHRLSRWTWARNPWDGKWMQLERARIGRAVVLEVNYEVVITLFHHADMSKTFANEEPTRISTSEKAMVLRAHVNLGHPNVKEFVRLLKAAGTRNDIIQYVLREFVCEGCLKEKRQPTRLPAATPRTYDFNVVIGIDLLFVVGAVPKEEHPVLNVTCIGTLYSTFSMVHPTRWSSALVWAAFLRCWLRVFGSPSFLIVDQGLEFQGEFLMVLKTMASSPF